MFVISVLSLGMFALFQSQEGHKKDPVVYHQINRDALVRLQDIFMRPELKHRNHEVVGADVLKIKIDQLIKFLEINQVNDRFKLEKTLIPFVLKSAKVSDDNLKYFNFAINKVIDDETQKVKRLNLHEHIKHHMLVKLMEMKNPLKLKALNLKEKEFDKNQVSYLLQQLDQEKKIEMPTAANPNSWILASFILFLCVLSVVIYFHPKLGQKTPHSQADIDTVYLNSEVIKMAAELEQTIKKIGKSFDVDLLPETADYIYPKRSIERFMNFCVEVAKQDSFPSPLFLRTDQKEGRVTLSCFIPDIRKDCLGPKEIRGLIQNCLLPESADIDLNYISVNGLQGLDISILHNEVKG